MPRVPEGRRGSAGGVMRDEARLRIANLRAALLRLAEYRQCTTHERRVALAQWLAEDLAHTLKRDMRDVPGE